MSSYDELLGTVARYADVAIEAEMYDLGWHKSDDGWLSDQTVTTGTVLRLDPTGLYIDDISTGERWKPEDGSFMNVDFRGLWRGWYERTNDAFQPWLGLPEPSAMDPLIRTSRAAADVLEVETRVKAEEGKDDAVSEAQSRQQRSRGGPGVVHRRDHRDGRPGDARPRGQLHQPGPGVIRARSRRSASPAPPHKNLIEEMRGKAIAKVADDVLSVMEDRGGGSDAAGALSDRRRGVRGASLFFTGPAVAGLIANGSTIAVRDPVDLHPHREPTPAEVTYGGGTAMEVFGNLQKTLEGADDDMTDGEDVQDSLSQALGEITGHPGVYDLAQPGKFLADDPRSIARARTASSTFDPDTLVAVARIFSVEITGQLRTARRGDLVDTRRERLGPQR